MKVLLCLLAYAMNVSAGLLGLLGNQITNEVIAKHVFGPSSSSSNAVPDTGPNPHNLHTIRITHQNPAPIVAAPGPVLPATPVVTSGQAVEPVPLLSPPPIATSVADITPFTSVSSGSAFRPTSFAAPAPLITGRTQLAADATQFAVGPTQFASAPASILAQTGLFEQSALQYGHLSDSAFAPTATATGAILGQPEIHSHAPEFHSVEVPVPHAPEAEAVHVTAPEPIPQPTQVVHEAPAPIAELKTLQFVHQPPAPPPEIKTVQYVEHQPAPPPVVKHFRLVHQLPPPPPTVQLIKVVHEIPPPPPQIKTVQYVHQHPPPPPEVKTVQVLHHHTHPEPKLQTVLHESSAHAILPDSQFINA